MKGSSIVCLLAAMAAASEDDGPWYKTAEKSTTLYDLNGIKWVLKTYTAKDEDKGISYLRFQHELEAPILPTDEVSFEIAFTTQNDPWTNKSTIAEDSAVCKMTRSTQNTKLWTQTSEDKYYTCATTSDCKLIINDTTNTFEGNADGTGNDWTNPLADDDEESPYCTPPDDSTSEFACKKIICIQQRKLETGDSKDF